MQSPGYCDKPATGASPYEQAHSEKERQRFKERMLREREPIQRRALSPNALLYLNKLRILARPQPPTRGTPHILLLGRNPAPPQP